MINNCPAQNLELKVQEGKEQKCYCILNGEKCNYADYQVCNTYWTKVLPLKQNIYAGIGVPLDVWDEDV